MLRARNQFADSVRHLVCVGGRFPQVVLLACFAAMVGIAGAALAADPAPAAATPAPPASNEASRRQAIEVHEKRLKEMERREDEVRLRRRDRIEEQKALRAEIVKSCGLSPENVLPLLLALEKERFESEIDIQVKVVRRQSIEDMVAKATQETNKRTESDVVLKGSSPCGKPR